MEKTDSEKQPPRATPPPEPPSSGGGGGGGDEHSSSNNPLYCSYVDGKFTYKDPSTNIQHVWNELEKKWVVKEGDDGEGGGGGGSDSPLIIDSNKLADSSNDNEGGGGGDGRKRNSNNMNVGEDLMSPSATGTSQVQFDGENYTYTDQDGTVFLWDAGKGAWFPKDPPSASANETSSSSSSTQFPLLPPSPPDLSQPTNPSTQSIGFFNPNYSTATLLTSPSTTSGTPGTGVGEAGGGGGSSSANTARRFYYASLSPTSMGVDASPGLFLSPDDQVNNNDQPQQQSLPPGQFPEEEVAVNRQGKGGDVDVDKVGDKKNGETEKAGGESDALPPGWEKHEDGNGPYYWHVKSGTIQRERPTLNSPVSSIVSQMSSNPALMIPGGMSGFVRRSNTVVGGFGGIGTTSGCSSNVTNNTNEKRKSWVNYLEDNSNHHTNKSDLLMGFGESNKKANNKVPQHQPQQPAATTTPLPAYEFDKNALKFAAVSLGCLSISEEDLTPERSSRAVSKVIAELTNGSGGGGKEGRAEVPTRIWTHTDTITLQQQMYLELTDSHLRVKVHKMADPSLHHHPNSQQSSSQITVLEQPIHSIRVWGVGREDPRDFAFVAREKQTRQFLCHVFRLEMYARPLASSLRDACKKIMIERQARIGSGGNNNHNNNGGGGKRPTSLGLKKNHNNHHQHGHHPQHQQHAEGGRSSSGTNASGVVSGVSGLLFPTPMDEPRKMIKAYYLGSKSVCKPTGMDVLNGAIDWLKNCGVEKLPVLVSVAPSVIGITSTTESPPKVQVEVRVRFLSFMGIGTDVRTCGVIIHTSRDDFEAHCFYSTPSTGALCKAIEAACVLRYQKCLDAHHPGDCGNNCNNGGRATRSNSTAGTEATAANTSSSTSSSTVTSPKSAAMIAASASNLASAFKTVLSSFGKGKSVDEGK